MKTRLLAIAMLLCATFFAKAQYITIPDANFLAWLNNNGFSQCLVGNQMDTTCPAVMNTTQVSCTNKSIADITGIQYFDALRILYCSNNSISSLPVFRNGLVHLACADNLISTLPVLPQTLEVLACAENNLSTIPALPSTLKSLLCRTNNITSLPSFPSTLNTLDCRENQLTSLPSIPAAMRYLDYSENLISAYVAVPDSVLDLNASYNAINTIPFLPSQVTVLRIVDCGLTSLPSLPNGLLELYCNENAIQLLPSLPNTLKKIICQGNQLHSLPQLPSALESLYCGRNNIESLPPIPTVLRVLECGNNNLLALPFLPSSVKSIYCSNNYNLSYIPNLPDSLNGLDMDSISVTCLPPTRVINSFWFRYNDQLSCLSSYPIVQSSNPLLSTIPLCTAGNANGCLVLNNLSGRTYVDGNANCILDNIEKGLPNVKHSLWQNGVLVDQLFTGAEGLYSFDTDPVGTFVVKIDSANMPFSFACPADGTLYDTLSLNDSIHYNSNFAFRCKTGFDLAVRSISTFDIFRPANNTKVDIFAGDLANFYGEHCANAVAGTVQVIINGPASYVGPANNALTPTTVANNVLTYNVADFALVNALTDFDIVVVADTFAQIGDLICFKVSITPTVGDNNVSNNGLTQCFKVVASYDPNDKTAYPSGDIDTAQEWLTYTVRFQNTGNAEAQHIYIMDTLDTDVDVSTFQLLAYSHQPNVQIKENIVRFNFPNINLPDSFSNEPGSHGYVQYKVKLKENLPIGTTIENTAHIYFDFNPPVVTNTTTNTIAVVQDTTGVGIKQVNALSMNIYPNPANSQVTVTTSQAGHTIYMYTAQGQLLSTQAMQSTATTINIEALPSGIYYIELSGTKGTARKKLVKL